MQRQMLYISVGTASQTDRIRQSSLLDGSLLIGRTKLQRLTR